MLAATHAPFQENAPAAFVRKWRTAGPEAESCRLFQPPEARSIRSSFSIDSEAKLP